MRIWSIHPMYLDVKGLTGVWREALGLRSLIKGKTQGYRHHPEARRFLEHPQALDAINMYLYEVWVEANKRGYNFDFNKLESYVQVTFQITKKRVMEEKDILAKKLLRRNPHFWQLLMSGKDLPKLAMPFVLKGD